MAKILIVLFMMIPAFVYPQSYGGIQFSKAKSWNEVLKEAKEKNRPIFIDAYATWCIPCKQMEQEVFSNSDVADYVNTNFVAVRVQMDSTKLDNDYIRGWYTDAGNWKTYVDAYPSYLFYTSNGEYLGKEVGYHASPDFVDLLKKIIDPMGSYLAQINAFKAGALHRSQIRKLAFWAKQNRDDSTAIVIAKYYKAHYSDVVPVDSLLLPEEDQFTNSFANLFSFEDRIIRYMYEHPDESDSKLGRYKTYSKQFTNGIIMRDNIYNVILPNDTPIVTTPNWKDLKLKLEKKYNKEIAQQLILDAQIFWAHKHEDWHEYVKLEFDRIDQYGIDTLGWGKFRLNNLMYGIVFKYIDDIVLLKKAASLMKELLDIENHSVHSHLDTYASILYKNGKKQRAIEVEEKAIQMAIDDNDQENIKLYSEVIKKMKDDLPIWK